MKTMLKDASLMLSLLLFGRTCGYLLVNPMLRIAPKKFSSITTDSIRKFQTRKIRKPIMCRSASTVNYDDVAYHFAAAKSLQSIVPKSTLDQLVNASDVDAYKVHDAFITNQTELLGNIIGWKVGATNDKARKALGFGPFYGPLFSKSCVQSESSISLRTWGRTLIAVEAELAVIMKANLTSTSADEAFKPDQVWECVGEVMSSIELASLRFEEKRTMGLTIADFAGNGCLILGDRIPLESNNQKLNWQCISDWNTDIIVNDHVKASNTCSNVMNNPILSVTWLANELKDRGYFLRSGDVIMTGAITLVNDINSGDKIEVRIQTDKNDPLRSYKTKAIFLS